MDSEASVPANNASSPRAGSPIVLTPNQIAAWNVRRLRIAAGMTQDRLAQMMGHFGIPWTPFTVSDAELAFGRPAKGRKFTADELALLALLFYVTPAELLVPPTSIELDQAERSVHVRVGTVQMAREAYLTDVLLRPSGVGARSWTGELDEGSWSDSRSAGARR